MFQIDFASRVPIYEQLCTNIIKLASAGVFKSGDKLPPVRILASQLGINPNTVAKAYRELESQGYIFSTVGRGSFLTDKLTENCAQKMLAIDNFKAATKNAYLFGVSKEEMTEIIENTFKESPHN
ncbi:GntR family transcriptional regulator [Ruminococcus sp.]|uniref:GntR family transcriptional regulator n=1 Tax=Ruminococcus sp. TaxID=41978 RepID=UPI002609D95F|nr:GntR family transcriptional regulator [Ruminococcus sp.]MDD6988963.1 GntR family transcriptional regulator [Ruminococcus sp.]MDY6201527.1 GntR family transcriptional regulator [Ruminococcus sp.]